MTRIAATRLTLLTLLMVNFLNFFDRVIPAVALEPIRREFALDDTQLGLLLTAFTLVYAVAGVPFGWLADSLRRMRLLAVGVFLWSLLTAASGVATNFVSLFLIRLGVGIGEASCAPAANSLIGDLYPAQKRSRALAVFMLGVPLGTLTAFSLGGWLSAHYGWRTLFYVAAVPGGLLALCLWSLPEPIRGGQEKNRTVVHAEPIARPYRKVMAIRTLWWLTFSGATFNFAAYGLNAFLPTMMVRYHQATTVEAGMACALIFGVTGVIGLPLGGIIADKLHNKFPKGRLYFGSFSLFAAAPLLWLGLGRSQGDMVVMTLLVASGWLFCFNYLVSALSSIQDVVEPRLRGMAISIFFFFQYVLGAGLGSLATGTLSDRYAEIARQAAAAPAITDALRAMGLHSSLLTVVPLSVLLAGMCVFLAARHYVSDAAKMAGAIGNHVVGKAPCNITEH
ncbi:TPA: MFS transporter [Serratia marcescens]|nr:MFS transporter [Serratia marcescens]